MRVDLNVIARYCGENGCYGEYSSHYSSGCPFNSNRTPDICLWHVPAYKWDIQAIERAYAEIVTNKAKEAIKGRME